MMLTILVSSLKLNDAALQAPWRGALIVLFTRLAAYPKRWTNESKAFGKHRKSLFVKQTVVDSKILEEISEQGSCQYFDAVTTEKIVILQ